jgi:hypothetical protein
MRSPELATAERVVLLAAPIYWNQTSPLAAVSSRATSKGRSPTVRILCVRVHHFSAIDCGILCEMILARCTVLVEVGRESPSFRGASRGRELLQVPQLLRHILIEVVFLGRSLRGFSLPVFQNPFRHELFDGRALVLEVSWHIPSTLLDPLVDGF